jgi:hypothetical protein
VNHPDENSLLCDLPEPYDMDAADAADAEACDLARQKEVDSFWPDPFDVIANAMLSQARSLNPATVVPKQALLAHYTDVENKLRDGV